MMYAPKCHDHRSLVFDFALGRLDDRDAMRAEHVLDSCEVCQAWWAENFECSESTLVDNAVGEVFPSIELPRRRTHRHSRFQGQIQRWMVAAAAALVIGIGALWQHLPGPQIQQKFTLVEEEISSMDFERGEVIAQVDSSPAPGQVAQMNFDSVMVVAKNVAPSAAPDGRLGGFDFESGSLDGLVKLTPNT